MPDFERLLRSLRMHVIKSPRKRALLKMYYRGVDHGRLSCLILFICLFLIIILIGLSVT
jgi:hypothetical protein